MDDVQKHTNQKKQSAGEVEIVRKRIASLRSEDRQAKRAKHSHGSVLEGSRQYPKKGHEARSSSHRGHGTRLDPSFSASLL